jgi:hypothetical protein
LNGPQSGNAYADRGGEPPRTAEKVTTVIAFVVGCVGFLVVLALVVLVVDAMGVSASRSLAAERRERWEARAAATRAVLARSAPRRTA